jgi:hypothetical protein
MADVVNAVADVDVVIAGAVGLEGGRQWRVIVAKKKCSRMEARTFHLFGG